MSEENNWYYAQGGRQLGPVPLESLRQMAGDGRVALDDLVWRAGMSNWLAASAVPEVSDALVASPTTSPYANGGTIGAPATLPHGIGYATPPYHPAGYGAAYAGFWLRFVAYIIDYAITYVAGLILGLGVGFMIGVLAGPGQNAEVSAQVVAGLIGLIVGWLYSALMESGPRQATLGKMALGLRVTDLQGGQISFGRATGRFFGKIISAMIFMIGFIMAGFTQRKQGLHDIMAGTLVLKRA